MSDDEVKVDGGRVVSTRRRRGTDMTGTSIAAELKARPGKWLKLIFEGGQNHRSPTGSGRGNVNVLRAGAMGSRSTTRNNKPAHRRGSRRPVTCTCAT